MKRTVEALAVLALLVTVAMGQQPQLPFPASANPALANNANAERLPRMADSRHDLPPAMAANQASTHAETPLPFPASANPQLGNNTNAETSPSVVDRRYAGSTGSPFPAAANPSK